MTTNPLAAQDTPSEQDTKKPRNYNGFLRNTNRKQKKSVDEDSPILHEVTSHVEPREKIQNLNEPTVLKFEPPVLNESNETMNKDEVIDKVVPLKRNNFSKNKNIKKSPQANMSQNAIPKNVNKINKNKNFKRPHAPVEDYEDMGEVLDNSNKENPFSAESLLFSVIRSRYGNNLTDFKKNLDSVLSEKSFNEIHKSNMSLIAYSVLYEYTEIFHQLMDRFGTKVSAEEFEKNIIPNSINKNPEILHRLIHFFQANYQASDEFIEGMVSKMGKFSYRIENNQLLLQWLSPLMKDTQQALFWQECINNNNVVLLDAALKNYTLHQFMKTHYNDYKDAIELMQRKYTVEKALQIAPVHVQTLDSQASPIAQSIVLEENTESHALTETDVINMGSEIKKTEVVIKRKKKVI